MLADGIGDAPVALMRHANGLLAPMAQTGQQSAWLGLAHVVMALLIFLGFC